MGKNSLGIVLQKEILEWQLESIIDIFWKDSKPLEALVIQFGFPDKRFLKSCGQIKRI